jgi:hypothetical protein
MHPDREFDQELGEVPRKGCRLGSGLGRGLSHLGGANGFKNMAPQDTFRPDFPRRTRMPVIDSPTPAPKSDTLEVAARLVLFGFPPDEVTVRIKPRSKQWRVRGAVQIMGVFLVLAPVVAILPPHAPWPIGALVVGSILARRRFSEDCTLVSLEGAECPKCGTAMTSKQTRLRAPHAINCEACHHQSTLKVPKESLTSSN